MRRLVAVSIALVAATVGRPSLAQLSGTSDFLEAAQAAYPISKVPYLFGPGSQSAAFAGEVADPAWSSGMENLIRAEVESEREQGLVFRRVDVECRSATCGVLLIHAMDSMDGSVGDLEAAMTEALGFAAVSVVRKQIPIVLGRKLPSDESMKVTFFSGYVEIVLRSGRRNPGQASTSPQAQAVVAEQYEGAETDTLSKFSMFAWPGSRIGGATLAFEAKDPQWSARTETSIRNLIDTQQSLPVVIDELECRTTVCGVTFAGVGETSRLEQLRVIDELADVLRARLDFEFVRTRGRNESLRAATGEILLTGARNAGPQRSFLFNVSQLLMAKNSATELAYAEEIVEANRPATVPVLLLILDRVDNRKRASIAYALARLGHERGMATLTSMIFDLGPMLSAPDTARDVSVQDKMYAIRVLGILRSPQAMDTLWRLVVDYDSPTGRNQADAFVLSNVEPVGDYAEQVLDQSAAVRSIPFLIDKLADPDLGSKVRAIRYLTALRAPEAVPYLEELLQDENAAAQYAGRALSGYARDALAAIASGAL